MGMKKVKAHTRKGKMVRGYTANIKSKNPIERALAPLKEWRKAMDSKYGDKLAYQMGDNLFFDAHDIQAKIGTLQKKGKTVDPLLHKALKNVNKISELVYYGKRRKKSSNTSRPMPKKVARTTKLK